MMHDWCLRGARLSCVCTLGLVAIGCGSGVGTLDPSTREESVGRDEQALGSINVLTRSYNNQRTGANLSETVLKPSNVNANQFGKLFQLTVDDQVYAQVLYASSVSIGGVARNVAYVATVNNTLYAFNADTGGAPLWQRNFNGSGRPPRNYEVANGTACGGYHDFSGNIGIVGTPVINAATSTLFVVTRTLESGNMIYRLRAIDITNGADRAGSPKVITATVPGTGDGSDGAGHIVFNPMFHNQRAGLALASNAVYVAFAAYCDARPYHGWVMGFDSTSLASTGVYATTPNGSMAGIWHAGSAPAIDGSGNVYVTTGNGDFDGSVNFGETLLKLTPRTLSRLDYFTPSNYADLNAADNDFGSAGPSFLPGSNLIINGGKEGKAYLVNSASLGHMVAGDTQIPQRFQAVDSTARPTATHHIHNHNVLWNSPSGLNMYVWGENDYLRAYRFNASTQKFGTSAVAVGSYLPPWGMPGGMMSLSANGSSAGTGILWATTPSQGDANQNSVPGMLHAFNAETLALLWQSTSPGDDVLALSKGSPPTVAAGKVYVASISGAVSVFGPRTGPTPPILNAVYQIRTGTTTTSCVDVNNGGTADGTNIWQWTCNGTGAQRFQFTNVANNIYEIRNVNSNKCVDVSNGGTANGTNVQLWTCNGTNAQRWAVQALGNGQYRLLPQTAANECLDISNGGTADGTNVQEWGCNGTISQIFTLALDNNAAQPIPNSTYRITTGTTSGKCVDIDNGGGYDGANVQQWGCNGSDAQRFRFRSLGGNLYEVHASVSEKCLDVSNSGTADGTNVQQWECNGTNAQIWSVNSLGSGRYTFSPQTAANECLDVNNSGTADGTNIWEWTCNGTAAQSFGVIAP